MNKICTSIEQSQKLIDLGFDVSTADMFYSSWTILADGEYILSPLNGETVTNLQREYGNQIIPAWSLTALLGLIPNFNMFKRTIECRIETTNHLVDKACDPIDAAFEMVCWLLESKKL